MDPIPFSKFSFDKITFEKPVKNGDYTVIDILYDSQLLTVKTPLLELVTCKAGLDEQIYVITSFKDILYNNKTSTFYNFIKDIDNHIIKGCKKQKWFPNKTKASFKKSFMKSSLLEECSEDTDNGWIYPLFRVEASDCDIYNKNRELVNIDELDNVNSVRCILQCDSIWINKNKFGLNWSVIQMQAVNKEKNIENDYMFYDSDNEDSKCETDYETDAYATDYVNL